MDKKKQNKSANISAGSSSSVKAKRDPSTHKWIGNKHIVKGGLFKDIKNIPFDRKVDVPHGVCFNCWEYGHSRQKCPKPDCGDHCRNCGRIGVKVTTCPRCSEAHRNYWQKMNNPQNQATQNLKSDLAKVRKAQKWNKANDKVALYHFAQVKSVPFDPELDIPFKVCANCWKPRHQGQCENDLLHAHCFNCGRISVYITNCPRCSEAYPRYCNKKIEDGIVEALPVKDESPEKPKEPEHQPEPIQVPPKPSVFKTITPTSTATRSFADILKNKDKGCVSQNGSVSNEETVVKTENSMLEQTHLSSSKDDGYFSQNGSVSNEETIIKIENPLFRFSCDYVKDVRTLMETIKHLSISNQDAMVSQFIIDRRKFIEQMNK